MPHRVNLGVGEEDVAGVLHADLWELGDRARAQLLPLHRHHERPTQRRKLIANRRRCGVVVAAGVNVVM